MTWKAIRDIDYLSRPPSQTEREAAESTSRQIREAINRAEILKGRGVEVFLQGSYANSTNVSGSSDVDVVAMLKDTFFWDFLGDVKSEDQQTIQASIIPATYSYAQYRSDLLAVLRANFSEVVEGEKAITVKGTPSGSRLDADVLPCVQFYLYGANNSRHEGISFRHRSGYPRIDNFPKQHRENMSAKNSDYRAGPKFKNLVRAMKRLRNECDPQRHDLCKVASSYWIECLMYNIPDDRFAGSHTDALLNCLSYCYNTVEKNPNVFNQANGVYRLFHPSFWDPTKAKRLVNDVWDRAFGHTP